MQIGNEGKAQVHLNLGSNCSSSDGSRAGESRGHSTRKSKIPGGDRLRSTSSSHTQLGGKLCYNLVSGGVIALPTLSSIPPRSNMFIADIASYDSCW